MFNVHELSLNGVTGVAGGVGVVGIVGVVGVVGDVKVVGVVEVVGVVGVVELIRAIESWIISEVLQKSMKMTQIKFFEVKQNTSYSSKKLE